MNFSHPLNLKVFVRIFENHDSIFARPCRFSSGDLTSELGDEEQQQLGEAAAAAGNRPPPLQTQPVGTGPPNIPPPSGKLIP